MIDEVLGRLIGFLQTASPMVWQALMRQVYVEAFARLAWVVGFVVVAYFSGRVSSKLSVQIEESEWEEDELKHSKNIADLVVIACVVIAFYLFISALMWFINPEFYAIRFILQQIK